jgi:hypothetical protein
MFLRNVGSLSTDYATLHNSSRYCLFINLIRDVIGEWTGNCICNEMNVHLLPRVLRCKGRVCPPGLDTHATSLHNIPGEDFSSRDKKLGWPTHALKICAVCRQNDVDVKLFHLNFKNIYLPNPSSRDRLCGLLIRVPGYRTEMYCASCEVRTEFM